jgi:hypothetical protein
MAIARQIHDDMVREPRDGIVVAGQGADEYFLSFISQIDAPTRVASGSALDFLPGSTRRAIGRDIPLRLPRLHSTKSVPYALLGLVINFKRVMARSLVLADFRNERQLPLVRRRLHAPTMVHGAMKCPSIQFTAKFRQ